VDEPRREPDDGHEMSEADRERLRRIEEEILRLGEEARFAEPHDPEFQARLRRIEETAESARARQRGLDSERSRASATGGSSGRGLGIGLSIAYAILGLTMLGWGVGWLLDRGSDRVLWQGIGTLLGATLAVVYAVRVMNRA
jgi:F0F1-type ATP synthase assembly protein I